MRKNHGNHHKTAAVAVSHEEKKNKKKKTIPTPRCCLWVYVCIGCVCLSVVCVWVGGILLLIIPHKSLIFSINSFDGC